MMKRTKIKPTLSRVKQVLDYKPKFINADCVHALAEMSASSVDSCIVDPPYGLGIHGLEWDTDVFNASVWSQVLRVAKPGCHLLAFGSTRKFHRLVTSIEDSGWEIRDTLGWIYATGLPKNFNISKGIDKFRRRDFIEAAMKMGMQIPGNRLHDWTKSTHAPSDKWWAEFKKFITPEQWISVERKVIGTRNKGKAIFGSCDGEYEITESKHPDARRWDGFGTALKPCWEPISLARKPVEGSVVMNVLDHGTGGLNIDGCRFDGKFPTNIVNDGDTGIFTENVSRFFYCPKPSKIERQGNTHPTIKPVELMRWLCRLITPPGGTVLDIASGSGTTGIASYLEGFNSILIERDGVTFLEGKKRFANYVRSHNGPDKI